MVIQTISVKGSIYAGFLPGIAPQLAQVGAVSISGLGVHTGSGRPSMTQ